MNPSSLFLETMKDLDSRIRSTDAYSILMIAALLRKLFLDGNPLVDQVNRKYRLKIKFRINQRTPPAGTSFWSIEDGLDPNTAAPVRMNIAELPRDQFLSFIVIQSGGDMITIKDLLLHAAHVQGAVHAGVAKDAKDKALDELISTIGIGGLPAGHRLMQAISRVVFKALTPLKEEIIRNP